MFCFKFLFIEAYSGQASHAGSIQSMRSQNVQPLSSTDSSLAITDTILNEALLQDVSRDTIGKPFDEAIIYATNPIDNDEADN